MSGIFVYNPESGRGKIKKYKDYIIQKLTEKYGKIDCVETTYAGQAVDIAKNSIGKYNYFFVSGGDGTINEVINGFGNEKNKPILGYIPSGTVNDVARSLKISRNIKKAVKTIVNGEIFEHDTFKVNDHYGIYVCCAGLFSKTSYDTQRIKKKKFGKLAYFFRGIHELNTSKPTKIELFVNNEQKKLSCTMLLILNSRSVAGFQINKKAKLDDGVVELVAFHSHEKHMWLIEILRSISIFLFGINFIKKNKFVTYKLASKFTIKMNEGTAINMDGEKSGSGSFDFEVINKGIKIIVPRKQAKKIRK